jgi:hypothetical protein
VPGGPGIITARDFKGADCTYKIELDSKTYLAHTDHREIYNIGDAVSLTVNQPGKVVVDDRA